MSNELTHKVVFIGNSAVGKTSILNQFVSNSSDPDQKPTTAVDFFSKTLDFNGQSIRLHIWDAPGQEQYQSLILSYLRNTTVTVIVFDLTSEKSFEDLKKWYEMYDCLYPAPKLVVVGNKADLEEERKISEEDGKKFAEAHQALYVETSARTPTTIDKLFEMISQIPITESHVYDTVDPFFLQK